MEEEVLVVMADEYTGKYGADSERLIEVDFDEYSSYIANHCKFLRRSIAEQDPRYKQIVSYCLIRYRDEVFVTKRLKKQTEARLHERWSIGIGGHMNNYDNNGFENIINIGCKRELHEEVCIGDIKHSRFLGIVNDNSSEVNSVHSGVCFIYDLDNKHCAVNEVEKMTGEWVKICNLKEVHYDKLEGWSQIFLNSLM